MGCACCEGLCIGAACPYLGYEPEECSECWRTAEYRVDGKLMCQKCASEYICAAAKIAGMDDDEIENNEIETLADIFGIDLEEI